MPRRAAHCLALTAILGGAAACSVAAGLGAAAVLGTTAAVVASCHDHVEVIVLDGAIGGSTCRATVTAVQDGDEVEFSPCYHAPLSAGQWQIVARLPGYQDATSSLLVEDRGRCDGSVQSLYLRLDPIGQAPVPPAWATPPSAPAIPPAASPPAPGPVVPAPTAPPTAPAPTAPPPTPAPTTPPTAPAPTTPPPAAPGPGAPPAPAPDSTAPGTNTAPVQRFPDVTRDRAGGTPR